MLRAYSAYQIAERTLDAYGSLGEAAVTLEDQAGQADPAPLAVDTPADEPGRVWKLSDKQRREIRERYGAGQSGRSIDAEMGLAKTSVHKVVAEAGETRRFHRLTDEELERARALRAAAAGDRREVRGVKSSRSERVSARKIEPPSHRLRDRGFERVRSPSHNELPARSPLSDQLGQRFTGRSGAAVARRSHPTSSTKSQLRIDPPAPTFRRCDRRSAARNLTLVKTRNLRGRTAVARKHLNNPRMRHDSHELGLHSASAST